MLRRFRRVDRQTGNARRLYDGVVGRSRSPVFYSQFQVADSIDGRFDVLSLHAYLVLEALKPLEPAGAELGTGLINHVFAGFDDALREMGVGDMGLSRRIKAMANAFYGRLEAYRAAEEQSQWPEVLVRNLYRGDESYRAKAVVLAGYMVSAAGSLRAHLARLEDGHPEFGPLPVLG